MVKSSCKHFNYNHKVFIRKNSRRLNIISLFSVLMSQGQRSICREIVEYVVYSSTSREIAHALWRL